MIRKLLKILSVLTLLLLVLLFIATGITYIYRDSIIKHFTNQAQENLVSKIAVGSIDVSLFENFPSMTISLEKLLVQEAVPGSTDTLLYADKLNLSFSIRDIINKNYSVKELNLYGAYVNVAFDADGNNNYTIYQADTSNKKSNPINFELDRISFERTRFRYRDLRTKNDIGGFIEEAESHLSWSSNILSLGIEGEVDIYQIGIDKEKYFEDKHVRLETQLTYNNESGLLNIEEGGIEVEQSLFTITGSYQVNDIDTIDLKIKASHSNIQTLLSLVPQRIYNYVKDYKSEGEVYFDGVIKGKIGESYSPRIDVRFGFNKAKFYHPESDQTIEDAHLSGIYTNGRKSNLTTSVLTLSNFKGRLSNQPFEGNFEYKNFDDPYIKLFVKGAFDAKNLFEFIPDSNVEPKAGVISLSLNFAGHQRDLINIDGAKNLNTSGQLFLNDLSFRLKNQSLDFKDFNGSFLFDHNDLIISGFQGQIGESDFSVSGYFKNVISFILLQEQTIGIAADFQSDFINFDELLSQQSEKELNDNQNSAFEFKIPKSLALQFNCSVGKIKFRNLSDNNMGYNFKGSLDLNHQSVLFKDVEFTTAGGKIAIEQGYLEARTNHDIHFFSKGKIEKIDVERVMIILNDLDQKFITHEHLKGTLSSNFNIQFSMRPNLEVHLQSIKSHLDLRVQNGQLLNFPPMVELGKFLKKKKFTRYLDDDNLANVRFSEMHETIDIEDEHIIIPKMHLKSSATNMEISGTHEFDSNFDYKISFPLINYRRRERMAERGVYRKKDGNEIEVHMKIFGNTDDFEIDFLEKETGKSFLNVAQDQFEEQPEPVEVGVDTTSTENEEAFENFFED